MKRVPFYYREPSLWWLVVWSVYGSFPVILPGVASVIVLDGWTAAGTAAVLYGGIIGGLAYPKTRPYFVKIIRLFYDRFRLHLHGKRMSRALRAAMENAGLTIKEAVEETDKETVIYYPDVKVWMDETKYKVMIRMLPGQTGKQWETKIDAFGHALGCGLVSSKISRGVVELVLQHGKIGKPSVPHDVGGEHILMIGHSLKGVLKWEFDQHPHMLIIGPTGRGKSTFLRNLLAQIPRRWTLRVCDGKAVEFSQLRRFGIEVESGVDGFVKQVEEMQVEVENRFRRMEREGKNSYFDLGLEPIFLVVDEFIYLIESLPKKKDKNLGESERERVMRLIRDISLRGRAAGCQIVLVLQRPDADFLDTVIRDNLTAKVTLDSSDTALKMVFGDKGKGLDRLEEKGYGYSTIGDMDPVLFRFPDYSLEKFLQDMQEKYDIPGTEQGPRGMLRLVGAGVRTRRETEASGLEAAATME